MMRWTDRVYGDVEIVDAGLLELIATPTFQRLRGIHQAGPSAFAFPFKTVTRFEHSLGVCLLLRKLGAAPREQVAGLLHDLSHTAFSHAVDFVFASDEQDHHESLKPQFLKRPDVSAVLGSLGLRPEDFFDDSVFALLERPLPWLCADRLDYFLRDSLACGVSNPEIVKRFLDHLTVIDQTIVFTSRPVARHAAELYDVMNRDWWASPTEAFIYNEFADAIQEGFRCGALHPDDLLTDDARVMDLLRAAANPLIEMKLDHVFHFSPECMAGFIPRITPKTRWINPPVQVGPAHYRRLSELPL